MPKRGRQITGDINCEEWAGVCYFLSFCPVFAMRMPIAFSFNVGIVWNEIAITFDVLFMRLRVCMYVCLPVEIASRPEKKRRRRWWRSKNAVTFWCLYEVHWCSEYMSLCLKGFRQVHTHTLTHAHMWYNDRNQANETLFSLSLSRTKRRSSKNCSR